MGRGRRANERQELFPRADVVLERMGWRTSSKYTRAAAGYPLTAMGEMLLQSRDPSTALPLLERAVCVRAAKGVRPTLLARSRFALARALWEAPADLGRDRARARALVGMARRTYEDAGEAAAEALAEVAAWQSARARCQLCGSSTGPTAVGSSLSPSRPGKL